MSLRVFLVDDEAPARARLRTLLADIIAQCPHQVIGEAENGLLALPLILEKRPDVVFLDMQMPGMNGLELAAHLLQHGAQAAIVFVTAFDEYALRAFEVSALDYLVKPVRAARLAQTLSRVTARQTATDSPQTALIAATDGLNNGIGNGLANGVANKVTKVASALNSPRQHFSVQERGRVLLVPTRDVLYLRAEQKYVTLRSSDRDYLIEDSLVSIEEEMADLFVRVHRNALVARRAIVGVERANQEPGSPEGWQVILSNIAERLPISRRQWTVIKALVR